MRTPTRLVLALLATAYCTTLTPAQIVGFATRGRYKSNGGHAGTALNYFAGEYFGVEYRNYFAFRIPHLHESVVAARLELDNPSLGFLSPDPFETYVVRGFAGNIPALVQGVGGATAFEELGEGTLFGTKDYSLASNGLTSQVPLNEAGVAAINAAKGKPFVVGGSVTTLSPGGSNEYVFGGTNLASYTTQLVLHTPSRTITLKIPVPPQVGAKGTPLHRAGPTDVPVSNATAMALRCTGQASSRGCAITLTAESSPSRTWLRATGAGGERGGLFLLSAGRRTQPFGDGNAPLCLAPPLTRGAWIAPSGQAGACDGSFLVELGAEFDGAHAQLWTRSATSNTVEVVRTTR